MTQGTSSARDKLATKRDLLRLVRTAIARGDLAPEAEQQAVESLETLVRRFALTRRDLLKATAATAGLTLVAVDAFTRSAEAKSILAATPSLTASVLRRDDMLALRFDLYNLVRDKDILVRQNAAQPAYIVLTPGYGADHAPQNIAEQAVLEKSPPLTPRNPPEPLDATDEITAADVAAEPQPEPGKVQGLLAGPSRIAFRLPSTLTSIPFSVGALLDLVQYEMSVAPAALPRIDPSAPELGAIPMRAPTETETSLEMPWHMVVSPHKDTTFTHSKTPVVHNGRTELWHTRLAVRKTNPDGTHYVDETDSEGRTIRAIWANDAGFDPATPPDQSSLGPFRMSLKPHDRFQIVHLSSDWSFRTTAILADDSANKDRPRPIDVENLILTALGGWQKTRGYWVEPPTGYNLGEWKHIATMGRDQYVKVVYLGWLLPFGHPAALVKVTERKVVAISDTSSTRGAYLRQRFFIVVRRPVMDYDGAEPQPQGGRAMPYKSVEIKTTTTPTLDDPAVAAWSFDNKKDLAFVPVVNSEPYQFSLKGTDHDDLTSEFTLPLVFVSYPVTGFLTDAEIANIVTEYASANPAANCPNFKPEYKVSDLGGQKVGLAPSTQSEGVANGKPGDTAVEVKSITWGAVNPDASPAVPAGHAPFYPKWTAGSARLNGVEQVSGNSFGGVPIAPHAKYLEHGFDAGTNPGSVFVEVTTPPKLTFASDSAPAVDRAGGVVNMDMSIGGLSRALGPMGGDLSTSVPTQFDPEDFFPDAKILGGIYLKDIIEAIAFDDLTKVPKMVTNTLYPGGDVTKPPEAVETRVNFVPKLSQDDLGIFDPDTDGATMTIDAKFRTPIDPPDEPTYEITGDLRDFRITLMGTKLGAVTFLVLVFNQLKFTAKNGKKPNVDVDIREVQFAGVLAFVNDLKDYLKFGDGGPSIDVTPTGVTAGFSIPIPTVAVGVLTIQNIAFGAELTIPFTGNPARVRFNFSERADPFLVTVIGLGGGGFFAIALGLDGFEMFEMSIEVGASVALDLGVASGEVHALAGMYYKLERIAAVINDPPEEGDHPEYDEVKLDAYVRLGGSVNVLGIASVSVEFYLGMSYQSPPGELWGQATLTVEVEVAMFSKSFEFTVERRIAGSSSSAMPMLGVLAMDGSTGGHMASLAAKNASGFNFTDLVSESEWAAYTAAFAA